MFSIGKNITSDIQLFIDKYRTDEAEKSINNCTNCILDHFIIPPLSNGDGKTYSKFIVDSEHSLVSLITALVPSPDWFVGLYDVKVIKITATKIISAITIIFI